ncbi:hypothetical protein [Pseudoalteromonas pernae]|uniref:hypothetical protein n=1 Tax=Pseudoalteromonas pernae TaxID=3118054 RepID=UPI003241DD46
MKKLLLFVVIVFALLSIDHPIIKEPRDKIYSQLKSDMSSSTQVQRDTKARKAQDKIREAISLNANQEKYIEQELSTNSSVTRWHQKYCVNKELNEYFYGDDLMQVCSILAAVPR